MELKGIFTILPERVGNENAQKLSYQIASKPENVKKLVENASTIGKKMSQELITPKQGKELNSKIKELNKRKAERILKLVLTLKIQPHLKILHKILRHQIR